jgi:hypothetical protein
VAESGILYERMPVPLTFTLTDSAGNAVQAGSAPPAVTVTQPDLTTTTPAVAWNAGTQQYDATGPSLQAGHYQVSWSCGDATYPGGFTDSYDIRGLVEGALLSLAEMKRTLRLALADTSEDDFVAGFGRSCTDIVEWYCGPCNQQLVIEELRVGGLVTYLSKPPVTGLVPWTQLPAGIDASRSLPSSPSPMFPVMVFGVAFPTAQLYADKTGQVRHTSGLPFYYGPYLWSYSAGRPVIPECIRSGYKALLKHIYGMERGGAAGGSASLAAADEETTETPFGYAVPNRALALMAPEALPGAIA